MTSENITLYFKQGTSDNVYNDYVVDGEAVGETLCVFDRLELDEIDLRVWAYDQRRSQRPVERVKKQLNERRRCS